MLLVSRRVISTPPREGPNKKKNPTRVPQVKRQVPEGRGGADLDLRRGLKRWVTKPEEGSFFTALGGLHPGKIDILNPLKSRFGYR